MSSRNLRRRFVDVGERQVHFRTNSAEGRPLVMLHASPGSSVQLLPLAEELAAHRHVVAIDTPGNGDSDPLPIVSPEIEDYADALATTLDALNLIEIDVYGSHTGANIALALANRHPEMVVNVVIDGLGVYTPTQQRQFLQHYAPEVPPDDYGRHLLWAWNFCRDQYLFFPWFERNEPHRLPGEVPEASIINRWAVEVIKALPTYHLAYRAAFRFDKRAALKSLTHRCIVGAASNDPLFEMMKEIAQLRPTIDVRPFPEASYEAASMIDGWLRDG